MDHLKQHKLTRLLFAYVTNPLGSVGSLLESYDTKIKVSAGQRSFLEAPGENLEFFPLFFMFLVEFSFFGCVCVWF